MNFEKIHQAKRNKADEFYTRLEDIIKELKHYKDKFRDKVIYLPCDNPGFSQFYYYFFNKFKTLGLKKLIASFYSPKSLFGNRGDSFVTVVDKGKKIGQVKLKGDGDFRSNELIPYWQEADIIVTNPPFSLFREFVDLIFYYNKKSLILGNINACSYRNVFQQIRNNNLFLGFTGGVMSFQVPDSYKIITNQVTKINNRQFLTISNACWFTNLFMKKNKPLELKVNYDDNLHRRYVNYDGINVDKIKDIPKDYFGYIGVPITYMYKHCHEQFDLIELGNNGDTNFINKKKMIILDKHGNETDEIVTNAKTQLYLHFNNQFDKRPVYKDLLTGELYSTRFCRLLIKRK